MPITLVTYFLKLPANTESEGLTSRFTVALFDESLVASRVQDLATRTIYGLYDFKEFQHTAPRASAHVGDVEGPLTTDADQGAVAEVFVALSPEHVGVGYFPSGQLRRVAHIQ